MKLKKKVAIILSMIFIVGSFVSCDLFQPKVVDTEAPIIEIIGNVDTYAITNSDFDLMARVKATDNIDGEITDRVTVEGAFDLTIEGMYEITYVVKDNAGNESRLTSKINVQDANTKGIPVLMYHCFYDKTKDVLNTRYPHNYFDVTDFRAQLEYLVENNYYFPTFQELSDYVDGKIELPRKSIILTEDDATDGLFIYAVPALVEYNVPMTTFVITDRTYWRGVTEFGTLNLQSHSNGLHAFKNGKGIALSMTKDEIKADLQTCKTELNGGGDALAYPFGHYSSNFVNAVEEEGYTFAFTTKNGRVKVGSNKLLEPRVRISRGLSLEKFIELVG